MSDPKPSTEFLQKLYEIAIEEYRFNVKLAWDRTKFFLLLSSALIAAGIGLFRFAQSDAYLSAFLVGFFFVSTTIAVMGLETLGVGKKYYREAVFKKTLLERELGLLERIEELSKNHGSRATYAISVTSGQQDTDKIFKERDANEKTDIASRSIIGWTQKVFWALIAINVIGAIASAAHFGQFMIKN